MHQLSPKDGIKGVSHDISAYISLARTTTWLQRGWKTVFIPDSHVSMSISINKNGEILETTNSLCYRPERAWYMTEIERKQPEG